jgi:hypothetical protein
MALPRPNKGIAVLALVVLAATAQADCRYYQQLVHGPWRAVINAIGEGGCSLQTVTLAIGTRAQKKAELTFRGSDPVNTAWLTDLDGNHEPELILVTTSAGSGSYSRLQLYLPRGKTLQPLTLPQLSESLLKEYRGHDRFSLRGSVIVREFPIYRDTDPNCCPSGGLRRRFYLFDGKALSLLP